jgi:hypothetical protein
MLLLAIALAIIVAWLLAVAVVVGLCVSAARGDAAERSAKPRPSAPVKPQLRLIA